jgi:hypothetical protein
MAAERGDEIFGIVPKLQVQVSGNGCAVVKKWKRLVFLLPVFVIHIVRRSLYG